MLPHLALLLLALAPPAAAQIYKWVDAGGVVNYGSAPPPGSKAQPLADDAGHLSVVPAPPRAPPAVAEHAQLRSRVEQLEAELARQQRERRAAAADAAARAAAWQVQCERNRRTDCAEDWRSVRYPSVVVAAQPRHRVPHHAKPPQPHAPPKEARPALAAGMPVRP